MKKPVSPADRRHNDYLRRKGLRVGSVYMKRLERLRSAECRRVVALCRNTSDPAQWQRIIENNFSEGAYLYQWYAGLYVAAGVEKAKSTARFLQRGKASPEDTVYEAALRSYALQRAGESIVSVRGTALDSLTGILRGIMEAQPELGIEKLSKALVTQFDAILPWQCRRIAQTETMISLAEAGRLAADTLDVRFVKQWACSGMGEPFTRHNHFVMDGVIVGEDEYFKLPDCYMLYPHDTSTNPPAGEIINCLCDCLRLPK